MKHLKRLFIALLVSGVLWILGSAVAKIVSLQDVYDMDDIGG
jgi:hypothetical protein